MVRALSVACLVTGASASLSDTVSRWNQRSNDWRIGDPLPDLPSTHWKPGDPLCIPGVPTPGSPGIPPCPGGRETRRGDREDRDREDRDGDDREEGSGRLPEVETPRELLPQRVAVFGGEDAQRSEQAMGNITLLQSRNYTYTAVEWNVEGVTIPADLIGEVCGDLDVEATRSGTVPSFTYGIHDSWKHRHDRSAQGAEACSDKFTGRRWDPTAACSDYSGNRGCDVCNTFKGYRCSPDTFDPSPDASGSFAYRFLNSDSCEFGDLSGMHGELTTQDEGEDAECRDQNQQCGVWAESGQCTDNPEYMKSKCKLSCGICQDSASKKWISIEDVVNDTAGFAQMSAAFGPVKKNNVDTNLIGINCDATGPPLSHANNCGCIRERKHEEEASSVGTLTVTGQFPFYLAGTDLGELDGKSIVVSCGSAFGNNAGKPLFCAKLADPKREERDADRDD